MICATPPPPSSSHKCILTVAHTLIDPHLKHFYMQQLLETLIHPVARQVRTASAALISEKLKRSVMAVQEPRNGEGSREGDSSQQQVPPETAMAQEASEQGAGQATQNEGSGARR